MRRHIRTVLCSIRQCIQRIYNNLRVNITASSSSCTCRKSKAYLICPQTVFKLNCCKSCQKVFSTLSINFSIITAHSTRIVILCVINSQNIFDCQSKLKIFLTSTLHIQSLWSKGDNRTLWNSTKGFFNVSSLNTMLKIDIYTFKAIFAHKVCYRSCKTICICITCNCNITSFTTNRNNYMLAACLNSFNILNKLCFRKS